MRLSEWAAKQKSVIFEDLLANREPSIGEFDPAQLRAANASGKPQMGTTRYAPDKLLLEFIYPESVFVVTVASPEPIRFLPVPDWVIESIWQGEIDGSYHFDSDAVSLFREFENKVFSTENQIWFGPRQAKRRE